MVAHDGSWGIVSTGTPRVANRNPHIYPNAMQQRQRISYYSFIEVIMHYYFTSADILSFLVVSLSKVIIRLILFQEIGKNNTLGETWRLGKVEGGGNRKYVAALLVLHVQSLFQLGIIDICVCQSGNIHLLEKKWVPHLKSQKHLPTTP